MFLLSVGFLYFVTATSIAQAQLFDLFGWPDESEEDEDPMWDLYEYDNASEVLITLKSSDIRDDRRILDQSSSIILEQVDILLLNEDGEDEDVYSNDYLDEQISDHTVQLYNVLQQSHRYLEENSPNSRKLRFSDILIWSNISEEIINDIIEEYYLSS